MSRIKKKLKSDRGASLSWALLIFLVCAVVGSAVLVAGTAAAGRMSKLAENDQRYYAVTSTAGLLRDVLKEKITVTRSSATTTDGKVTYSISYGTSPDKILNEIVRTIMDWPASDTSTETSPSTFWNKDSISISSPTALSGTLTLSSSVTNAANAVGEVNVDLSMEPDGSITATVSKDGFSLQLFFEMVRDFSVDSSSTKKTDDFRWELKDARKVVAQGATPTATP